VNVRKWLLISFPSQRVSPPLAPDFLLFPPPRVERDSAVSRVLWTSLFQGFFFSQLPSRAFDWGQTLSGPLLRALFAGLFFFLTLLSPFPPDWVFSFDYVLSCRPSSFLSRRVRCPSRFCEARAFFKVLPPTCFPSFFSLFFGASPFPSPLEKRRRPGSGFLRPLRC